MIKKAVSWFDDLIFASDNIDSFTDVKKMLTSEFRMKDIEKFNHFRGKRLWCKNEPEKVLNIGMLNYKPMTTPCE